MTPDEEVGTRTTVPLAPEPAAVVRPSASTPARAGRRGVPRYTPEPVDYSKDYAHTRRDLRWIAIWSILLFVAMFVLKFSGIV